MTKIKALDTTLDISLIGEPIQSTTSRVFEINQEFNLSSYFLPTIPLKATIEKPKEEKVYYPPNIEEYDLQETEEVKVGSYDMTRGFNSYDDYITNRDRDIKNLIMRFITTGNLIYINILLFRYYYNKLADGFNFQVLNPKWKGDGIKIGNNYINKTSNEIKFELPDFILEDVSLFKIISEGVETALKELYFKPIQGNYTGKRIEKFCYLRIDNSEIFTEILKNSIECKVDIDPELLQGFDFKELRSKGNALKIYYLIYCKQLLLMDTNTEGLNYGDIWLFSNEIAKLPKFMPFDINTEKIIINNKTYSKSIFESIIEMNLEDFLINLELETLLEKQETDVVDHLL